MEKSKINKKNNRTKWLWIITIFVLLIFIFVLVFVFQGYFDIFYGALNINKQSRIVEKVNTCRDCVRRYIDGVYVKPGEENLFPVALIMENHVDARPQFGLSKANLVYEAEAEGGITRFLAFFSSNEDLEKIGPVRSARAYFVDWTRELSALLVHVGGSPQALVKISKENIFNLNEFYQGQYFWRSNSNSAPHNVYTSTSRINKYLESKNISEGKFFSWKYKDDSKLENRPDTEEIKIDFQLPDYIVKWKYGRENNEYIRYMDDQIHKDASSNEIKAKNIIIEFVRARVIDEELRLKMDHIGEGKALVCLDGKCEEGEWRKKTSASRTRFYKIDNEEFKFNAGTTWIEIVRPEYEVSY